MLDMLLTNVAEYRHARGWPGTLRQLGAEVAGSAMYRAGTCSSDAAGRVGTLSPAVPTARLEDQGHRELILTHMSEGSLPLKYAYTGSAAKTHDTLARTSGYAEVIGATQFEVDTLLGALQAAPPRQIAEIGPGNGVHSAAFLGAVSPGGVRYLGLDFSNTLLALAMSRIAQACPSVERASAWWDVEAGATDRISAWRDPRDPVLICLLGHTLGNLEVPTQALRNLAFSAKSGDLLLLGLSLMPPGADKDAVLAPYRNEVFSAAVLEPLRAADIEADAVRLDLRLRGRTVLGEVTFRRPVSLDGYDFRDRCLVRCFTSARFLPGEALDALRRTGWRVCGWAVDGDASHMAVVARR
jgi:L-histidine Nalpha-methyltransferase